MSTFDWLFEPERRRLIDRRRSSMACATSSRAGRSTRVFPRRRSACCSEWAVFGARNENSGWLARGFTSPRSAMPAEKPKIRPIAMFARDEPAMPRSSWSFTILRFRRSRGCCGCSGKATIRPKGCARAMTSARSIARRFSPIPPPNWRRRELGAAPIRTPSPNAVLARSPRKWRRLRLCLRGGGASAISREKSRRLLRTRRHRTPAQLGRRPRIN